MFKVGIHEDLQECIKQVSERLEDMKIPGLAYKIKKGEMEESYIMPLALKRALYSESKFKKMPISMTNMAGPRKPIYFEGKRVHWRISAVGAFTNTFAV